MLKETEFEEMSSPPIWIRGPSDITDKQVEIGSPKFFSLLNDPNLTYREKLIQHIRKFNPQLAEIMEAEKYRFGLWQEIENETGQPRFVQIGGQAWFDNALSDPEFARQLTRETSFSRDQIKVAHLMPGVAISRKTSQQEPVESTIVYTRRAPSTRPRTPV
jgi:hypothetical protein